MKRSYLVLLAFFFQSQQSVAFPENVRQGYASCQSCHISPSGGGLLSKYGKKTSEEFMSTWTNENESDAFGGLLNEAESLLIGGDVRVLSVQRDNNVFHYSRTFPMQADIELGYSFGENLTVVGNFGSYDGTPDSRRHYIMYQPHENWLLRGGLFFNSFGLQIADHSASIRQRMNFNQSQETYNLEVAYMNENFEVIFDLILGKEGEGISRETGASSRLSYYLGERSVIGFSLLSAENEVWKRIAMGPHGILGFSKTTYLLAQTTWESKASKISNDTSLEDHTNLHSYFKLGWEFYQGAHLFAVVDDSHSMDSDYLSRKQSYGIGAQWLPRPHFEFEGRLEQVLDERYSDETGDQFMLLSHYYF